MNRPFALLLIVILCTPSAYIKSDFTDLISQQFGISKPLFNGLISDKQQRLADLKKQRAVFTKEKAEFDTRIHIHSEEIKALRIQIQKKIEKYRDDEYLKQKLTLLNEIYQTIKELKRSYERYLELHTDYRKIITEYVDDPAFAVYQKEKKLKDKLYYSFEDVQKIYDLIVEQQKHLDQLLEQKKAITSEVETSKRAEISTEEDYRKRKETLEAASIKNPNTAYKPKMYQANQVSDLLALEQQLYEYRQTLERIKRATVTMQEEYVGTKLLIVEGRLKILNDFLQKVKRSVKISEANLEQGKEEFEQKRHIYFTQKEILNRELEQISDIRKKKERELETLSSLYGIQLGNELDDHTLELQHTPEWMMHFSAISSLNSTVELLKKQQELIEAQIVLQNEKYKYDGSLFHAKQTYYKVLTNKFTTEDEISNEIKNYNSAKIDARSLLQSYKDQVMLIPDLLNNKKRSLNAIATIVADLQNQKDTLFAENQTEFTTIFENLETSRIKLQEYMETLGKLTSVYSELSAVIANIQSTVDLMVTELKSITFWYRPDYAISWQDISNISPDLSAFFFYIRSYLGKTSISSMLERLVLAGKHPFDLFILGIKLILVISFICMFFFVVNALRSFWLTKISKKRGLNRVATLFATTVASFILSHSTGIALWILLFCTLQFQAIPDPALYIFFYLGSIPYWLYLANSFLQFFAQINAQQNYLFLAEEFEGRFFAVTSFFLYATIVIVFFREAFILINYYGSALPVILLATNFIIFQISLILLISKEQIVHLISSKNAFWQWIRDTIEHYFYHFQFLLIAIIIMSNPYVGYGRVVLYGFFCLVYTGVLIATLLWLYGFFKRITSSVFFLTDDEVVKERFSHAKMWFGLFIITSFLLLLFVGIIVGAKIWGRPITYQEIYRWVTHPITHHSGGKAITPMSLFAIIGFILTGLLLSQAFNRYVLDKIFDLLLVDSGVQYTVTSIAGYVFFLIALFLGFHHVGLDSVFGFGFAALTFSLGWVLKEPIGDFVAYFVILVQRPVKIGDYIRIDNEVMGVVRRISVRSVVLRRRNSTTVVVPNSHILSHVVTNWNYVRGFIAFDDITITIDYREDPIAVRELLISVIESHSNILRTPRPIVRLENFSEFGFVFLIRGFMSSLYTLDQWDIASDIRLNIAKTLREKNIKIALPARIILPNGLPQQSPDIPVV